MKDHQYFVYILSNRSRNTYTGVTNDLVAACANIAPLNQARIPPASAFIA